MKTMDQSAERFVNEIAAMPGGDGVRLCIQCGTCSASCANADRMDHTVRKIIAMVRAGLRDEVLTSNSCWLCLSCYLCTVRCPRAIQPTELMHAICSLAYRSGLSSRRTRTPILYRSFTDFVYTMGIVPEVGLMTLFYLRSNPLRALKMLPLAITLYRRGRLAIKAPRLKPEAQRQLKTILEKAGTLGGLS